MIKDINEWQKLYNQRASDELIDILNQKSHSIKKSTIFTRLMEKINWLLGLRIVHKDNIYDEWEY